MLKPELFDLCSRFAAKPEFLIDKIDYTCYFRSRQLANKLLAN